MNHKTLLSRRSFLKVTGAFWSTLTAANILSACTPRVENLVPSTPEPQTPEVPTASEETPEVTEQTPPSEENSPETSNILVAYFSYPETTEASDPNNLNEEEENSVVVKDGEIIGNTEYVANIIARETGADTFRILTTRTYPVDHQALIAQAQDEINAGDRPDLAEPIPDLSGYDTIFIGHPIWWAELPPIMHSFLEQADLAGKQIYLFNTHGGSGNAGTKEEIMNILSESTVSDNNFVVSRDTVADCEPDVIEWVQSLDLGSDL